MVPEMNKNQKNLSHWYQQFSVTSQGGFLLYPLTSTIPVPCRILEARAGETGNDITQISVGYFLTLKRLRIATLCLQFQIIWKSGN